MGSVMGCVSWDLFVMDYLMGSVMGCVSWGLSVMDYLMGSVMGCLMGSVCHGLSHGVCHGLCLMGSVYHGLSHGVCHGLCLIGSVRGCVSWGLSVMGCVSWGLSWAMSHGVCHGLSHGVCLSWTSHGVCHGLCLMGSVMDCLTRFVSLGVIFSWCWSLERTVYCGIFLSWHVSHSVCPMRAVFHAVFLMGSVLSCLTHGVSLFIFFFFFSNWVLPHRDWVYIFFSSFSLSHGVCLIGTGCTS